MNSHTPEDLRGASNNLMAKGAGVTMYSPVYRVSWAEGGIGERRATKK